MKGMQQMFIDNLKQRLASQSWPDVKAHQSGLKTLLELDNSDNEDGIAESSMKDFVLLAKMRKSIYIDRYIKKLLGETTAAVANDAFKTAAVVFLTQDKSVNAVISSLVPLPICLDVLASYLNQKRDYTQMH
ncbi:hypothetical protein HDU80_008200 [Chytriomyces hyalinus]|nr:hypothetical protein HDU80_008200 [Chytriomyces hyalinus]